MQKKLLAVAVAGALGAPAVAMAQSTVQVFGNLYVEYSYVNQGDAGTGGSRPHVDMLQAPGSEIGFRGEEKLGGGLSAWFQCATTADVRGTAPGDGLCSRNSAVGLKGSFGNLFVGTWDTPFKRAFVNPGSRDTGVFGSAFLLAGNSTTASGEATGGVAASNRVIFKRRQRNLITYETPTFQGFQLMGAFSTTNSSTGVTSAATSSKPRIWSLAGDYRNGPLHITAAYERHNEFGATGGDDDGWLLGVEYTFMKSVKVGGMYTEQKFETGVGAETKVKAWTVGVEWNIQGPHSIHASYTQADDTKGNGAAVGNRLAPGTDNGAKLWQIRYVHDLSKRTQLQAGYVRLDNDTAGVYQLGGFTIGTGAGSIKPGDNQSAFAVSIAHRF